MAWLTALLAAGCASADETSAGARADAVATAYFAKTTRPVVSEDGTAVIVGQSRGDLAHELFRIDVASGRVDLIARRPVTETTVAHGTQAHHAWFVVGKDAFPSPWSVGVRRLSLSTEPVYITPSEGTSPPRDPDHIVITPDDQTVGFLHGAGRFLTVADTSRDGAGLTFDLGQTYADRSVVAAPDGSHLLVLKTDRALERATLRRVELGAKPALGAEIAIEMQRAVILPGSYDGRSVLVAGRQNGGNSVFARVDAASGAMTVLTTTEGWSFRLIEERDHTIWYERDGAAIERVARYGGTAPVVVARAASWPYPTKLVSRLSHDGSALIYADGEDGLFAVPSDGSAPPKLVRPWTSGLEITKRGGERLLVRDDWTAALLDDRTGEELASWPDDFARWMSLSADGAAVYQARACKVGEINGTEVLRVSGGEQTLVPCAPGTVLEQVHFETVPHSSATVLWMSDQGPFRPSSYAMLLRP